MPPVELDRLSAAVHEGGLLVPEGVLEVLLLRGADTADLLHRLSTNDILRPVPGSPVRTVLTTEKGRIIDDVEVIRETDRTTVICHATALDPVASWIERFIINEDVEIDRATPDLATIWIIGNEVPSVGVGGPRDDDPDASSGGMMQGLWSSALGRLPGYRCLVRRGEIERMRGELVAKGMYPLNMPEFHLLRIAAGVPWYPSELNSEHNPLECGLREHVSFTKGCYVGQEVVARLDAYDKVQRTLGLFRIPDAPVGMEPGVDLVHAGSRVGNLTSMTPILSDGSRLALGFVERKEAIGPGGLSVPGPAGLQALAPWVALAPRPTGESSGGA